MLTTIFLIVFLFISVIHLKHVNSWDESTRNFTKPLLMPILALFYIFAIPELRIENILIFSGIIACGVGDTLLMLENTIKDGFLYGMLAFALGHLLYALSISIAFPMSFYFSKILLFIPIIYILYKTFPKYYKKLGNIKVYVYIYMSIILLLAFLSITAINPLRPLSIILYGGILSFIFSDSLLAMIDFGKADESIRSLKINGRLYIMGTYLFAQLLIAISFIF